MDEFQLFADEFNEADRGDLVGFSCGEDTVARSCTQWIKGSDVVDAVNNRGTKVWLFRDQAGTIVGYGSLGTVAWRWPDREGGSVELLSIPMLGLDQRFHSYPPENPTWKYSRQIVGHLLAEAPQQMTDLGLRQTWIVLLVDPNNQKAIALYQRFRFNLIPSFVPLIGFMGMARRVLIPE